MRETFLQSMAWLHTWTGLVVGWVLFFVFVTGTVGYFYVEIDRWMRPELPPPGDVTSLAAFASRAEAYLRSEAPGADTWSLSFPGSRGSPGTISWTATQDGGASALRYRLLYDAEAGVFYDGSNVRETGGGFLLYRMHKELYYLPQLTGQRIVGACSMIMLVALITGVITHRKIFRNFFTFRPGKGQLSWLDFHNVVSVLALPFFLMITFSGLVFFAEKYLPSVTYAAYGGDHNDYARARYGGDERQARTGRAAPVLSFDHFLSEAERYWGKGKTGSLTVSWPGDAVASARLTHNGSGTVLREGQETLHFSATSGKLTRHITAPASVPRLLESALFGLHEGIFAGWGLRWLYFGSSVLGCAMIATGLILWTVKRRRDHAMKKPHAAGFRVVECLNIGTIAGLPIGIAAFFWANRLLPTGIAGRADWEVHVMFAVWGIMLLWAAIRRPDRAWVEELWIAASAFGLLPVLNALTTDRHLLAAVRDGDWALAGFDLTVLALGLFFAATALKVRHKYAAPHATQRAAQRHAEAAP